jgi:hypothetical protein
VVSDGGAYGGYDFRGEAVDLFCWVWPGWQDADGGEAELDKAQHPLDDRVGWS